MMGTSLQHRANDKYEKAEFGFWLYLMTDIILFASLFATYMILRNNVAGGETGADLFDTKYALVETIILLVSSFTAGVAALAFRFKRLRLGIGLLGITLLAGLAFIGMELSEFSALLAEGNSWQNSAFLSAFFVLVGTHGLHISIGLIWGAALLVYLIKQGVTANSLRKYTLFSLFWHFLDLVWIFIFSIAYLGALL